MMSYDIRDRDENDLYITRMIREHTVLVDALVELLFGEMLTGLGEKVTFPVFA